jgi:glutamate-1-semialdehyde 2,1-aminomutase
VNSPVRAFRAVGGGPVFIAEGRGARVRDADGREYVDYLGSWGPLILGHAPARTVAAAARALRRGATFGAPCEAELELAALVRDAFPSLERLRFVSSGTEACMSALRLARGVTGRTLVAKFAGCYHGHSDGLLVAAGSGATTFGHPTSAGVPDAFARQTLVLEYNDVPSLEKAFRRWGRGLAAVIVEPVAANMGVIVPKPSFLETLRRRTKQYGALLIFDEVVTGFRLAWGGAQERLEVRADMTCLGKIVGGGLPVGAFGGTRRVMDKLAPQGPVYQAGTLSGNPVAMAAGAATLEELKTRPPYARLRRLTAELAAGLRALARRHGEAVTVNDFESMFTAFFHPGPVGGYAAALRSDTRRYARFFHGLLKHGVYFPPAQFEAAFLSAAHTEADVERTLAAADKAFRAL